MRMRPGKQMLPFVLVGLGATSITLFVLAVVVISWFSNPPFGLGNAPPQPIAFPHTVHVAQQGIPCEFCHRNVTKGESATVPAVQQCMFCHKQVLGTTDSQKAEIAKVTQAFADNAPINWERVHRLPDHVRFVHEAHIRYFSQGDTPERQLEVGQVCSKCHKDVANMDVVIPGETMKMGTCLDCHRENGAPTDCTICHK